jgi:hypothetical protein
MKNHLLHFAALCLLPLTVRAGEPLTTAVLDFQTGSEDLSGKGAEAAVLLNAQLSGAPAVILVERQELAKILGEQELGLSGTVDPATAAKVGSITGAKVLITGRVFGAGGKFYAVAKIISTETSRVYGEVATFTDLAALDKATEALAGKIGELIDKQGATLVAPPLDSAARLEALKKSLTGKSLPSVAVEITEQHLERPTIDPAAQTEMRKTLLALGFPVIDPKSSGKSADVTISGEAFSEIAGRRGNLVSCRARVEIKVVKTATGELLVSDSQTESAVDLAEHVAGKRALERASEKLLERILPKISAQSQP